MTVKFIIVGSTVTEWGLVTKTTRRSTLNFELDDFVKSLQSATSTYTFVLA